MSGFTGLNWDKQNSILSISFSINYKLHLYTMPTCFSVKVFTLALSDKLITAINFSIM